MATSSNSQTKTKPTSLAILSEFELRSLGDYAAIIRKRWILAALCATVVPAAVAFFFLSRPPVYLATASVMIERQGARVMEFQEVVETRLDGPGDMWQSFLENHLQQLTSRTFFEYVAATFSEAETNRFLAPYTRKRKEGADLNVINVMTENVSVELLGKSFVARINVRHQDPTVAGWVADRFVDQYARFILERSASGNQAAISFLSEQAAAFRQRVDEADHALQEYRRMNHLVSVEEYQNIIVQRLREVSAAFTSARIERLSLESQLRQVEEYEAAGRNLLEITAIASVGSIPELLRELDRLRMHREDISGTYTRRDLLIAERELAIVSAQTLVQENVRQAVAELRTKLRNAMEIEESLLGEQRQAERESLDLADLSIHYKALKQNADSLRTIYSQVVARLNETSVASQLISTNIKVADYAGVPLRPVEPNLIKVLVFAVLLAGGIFVGLPIGLDVLDYTVRTPRDVEGLLNQTFLGAIPAVPKVANEDRPHIFFRREDDMFVEAFRGLVAQIETSAVVSPSRILLVTSTLPAEGKTLVSNNLAHALAAHGKRVVLIDADLRRPCLHASHDLRNDAGLLTWLATTEEPRTAISSGTLGLCEVAPNVSLIRSGGHSMKATEHLSQPRVKALLTALTESFDMVVIDSPPIGVFPDALTLAKHADDCVYVVRFGKVDRRRAIAALDHLSETKVRVLGVTMNCITSRFQSDFIRLGYGYGDPKYRDYYAQNVST